MPQGHHHHPVPKKSTVSSLNDYLPVALAPIVMKCFERLVMMHIKTLLPLHWLPYSSHTAPNTQQTTPQPPPSSHSPAQKGHTCKNAVQRLQFSIQHNYSSAPELSLNLSLCNWILDFLSERPHSLEPLQHTEHRCPTGLRAYSIAVHSADSWLCRNAQIKPHHQIRNDTTVVGLISKNDELAYKEEVHRLTDWGKVNVDKMKEMIVDFRRAHNNHSLLGVHLAENLTWSRVMILIKYALVS